MAIAKGLGLTNAMEYILVDTTLKCCVTNTYNSLMKVTVHLPKHLKYSEAWASVYQVIMTVIIQLETYYCFTIIINNNCQQCRNLFCACGCTSFKHGLIV